MRRLSFRLFVLILISFTLLLFYSFTLASAANCDTFDCFSPEECQRKIQECQAIISAYTPAQTKNKEQLAALDRQLSNLEKLIKSAETQIKKVEKEIFDREVALEYQKEVFNARVRSFYIRSRQLSPFLLFLASDNAAHLTRELSYRTVMANMDKTIIIKISGDLVKLQEDKDKLEENRSWLAENKENINKQAVFLRGEVEKVESYLGEISGKIASLTAKQQALLAARAGTFTTSVGDVPLADDPNARPDYDPGFRPAFAAFSFGAYTHRKGMSQYGALGRANSNQNAEQILAAYYPGSHIEKNYPTMETIVVDGYGSRNFEDEYMKRIYEIPNSWSKEVLKAQAIAARTYAVRRTNNGASSICATQSCQVYKDANKGGAWEEAVNETKHWVAVDGSGQPVSGYYSSTTGGYLLTSGWDTTCGDSSCWTDGAYEKIAGSPWFYKGWYTESYLNNSAKCNRSHPWLTQEEFADILNAWVVRQHGSEEDVKRILPITINSCPISGFSSGGIEPYSISELREKANGLDGAYTSVSAVSQVNYSNDGFTSSLKFQTNRGEVPISGSEFKEAFNLRAPGYISIRSKLFNIEKK